MNYVYFAESLINGKVYIGHTEKNPSIRINEHNQGSNAWSRNNRPLKLIYYEEYCCKEDACKRELFYKTGFGRQIKEAIIAIVKNMGL
jgi:predicted GIY-YIG superfamily endonuclease